MNYWKSGNMLITCTKAGGMFKKGEAYPFYYSGGYAYIVIIDIDNRSAHSIRMDCYESRTFKIIGCIPEWEDAEFEYKDVI